MYGVFCISQYDMAVSVGAGQESGIGNSESLWVMILKGCLGNIGARSAAPGTFEDSLVQSQSCVWEGGGGNGRAGMGRPRCWAEGCERSDAVRGHIAVGFPEP